MLKIALVVSLVGFAMPAAAQDTNSPGQARKSYPTTSDRARPAAPKKARPARSAKSATAPTRAPEPSRSDPAGTVPQGAPGTQNPTIPAERTQPADSRPRGG